MPPAVRPIRLVPSLSGCVPPSLPSERMRISLPRGCGAAAGCAPAMNIVLTVPGSFAGGAAPAGAVRVPHEPQNKNPCGTKVPQLGQGAPATCAAGTGGCAAPDLVLSSVNAGGAASLSVS